MRPARAYYHRVKILPVLVLAMAALLPIARGAHAQEMAPGPQNQNQQSAAPDSTASDSSAPQSAAPASAAPETPPSRFDPSIFQKPLPSTQLAFLNNFSGEASGNAIQDKQYRKLLHNVIPDCLFFYGNSMPLFDAFDMVIGGSPQSVQIREGRYVTVSGANGPYREGRGLLWIDMQTGMALAAFYFHPVNGEPAPTLTVFSKQVTEKSIELSQLPPAFIEDLNQWAGSYAIRPVLFRYFIAGLNAKILLAHDEDFCVAAVVIPPPYQESCQQMNADAADDDMAAAYYLEQTNYIPDATAQSISSDEESIWIVRRDQACILTSDPLACHIRMTREHTRAIVNRRPLPASQPSPRS